MAPVPRLRMAAIVAAAALEEVLVAEPVAALAEEVAVEVELAELVEVVSAVKLFGLRCPQFFFSFELHRA